MWYYNNSLQHNMYNLGKELDGEIKQLAERHDMTNIGEYKLELEKYLIKISIVKSKLLDYM